MNAELAATGFAERYGTQPLCVWSAPGRVNLIGEHTDYNEGFAFPFAINRRTYAALGKRSDRTIRLSSTFASEEITISIPELMELANAREAGHTADPSGKLSGWPAYPLGVIWALIRAATSESTGLIGEAGEAPEESELSGVDLSITSAVPVGAGLSSSAAIECAVATALNDHWGLGLSAEAIAKVGQRAENTVVGAPIGILDQTASMFGVADAAVFLDCRSLDTEVIPLGFDQAELEVLVIDTQVAHDHATGGYAARRASCENGAARLGVSSLRDVRVEDLATAKSVLDDETFRRVRHIVTENKRVLDTVRTLREQGPAAIGNLLNESHVSMRDDFEISVPELDLAVMVAQDNGAIGARMTGGGFGGSAIALIAKSSSSQIMDAIGQAFAQHGFAAPQTFAVRADDGARREPINVG